MELPKFLLADNTDFPDDLYVVHLEFPRFVINMTTDEVEILEDPDEVEESELQTEMERLIAEADVFYERELKKYDEE
jgi:alpha/beta superfamily hydrolase